MGKFLKHLKSLCNKVEEACYATETCVLEITAKQYGSRRLLLPSPYSTLSLWSI